MSRVGNQVNPNSRKINNQTAAAANVLAMLYTAVPIGKIVTHLSELQYDVIAQKSHERIIDVVACGVIAFATVQRPSESANSAKTCSRKPSRSNCATFVRIKNRCDVNSTLIKSLYCENHACNAYIPGKIYDIACNPTLNFLYSVENLATVDRFGRNFNFTVVTSNVSSTNKTV